jgi:hypothetical protein
MNIPSILQSNMIKPSDYNNIGGINMSYEIYPTYYKPTPTSDDYSKGYIYRYLIQKISDLTIIEVNKNKYNELSTQYYTKIILQWIISGPKNNQYKNKILERKGVQEQNIQTLVENEKSMKGLKNYLNNPLEFWGGK